MPPCRKQKQGQWVETSAELVPDVRKLMNAGDVVLAKGQLSPWRLSKIVDAIRKLGHPAPQPKNEETRNALLADQSVGRRGFF